MPVTTLLMQFLRGLASNRTNQIPLLAEPLYTTDTGILYIGDGVTPGGKLLTLTSTQLNALNMSGMVGLTTTQVGTLTAGNMPAFSGDISTLAGTTIAALANVNVNPGQYGSITQLSSLNTDAKGRILSISQSTVAVAPAASRSALKIQVTSSTALTVVASSITMVSAAGAAISKTAINYTINTATVGLNGLDTGTLAASTWYYVYAVTNGTTTGVVLSTSSTAPNASITNTYPYYARIGSVVTNASSLLIGTLQYGNEVQYILGGVNLTTELPVIASGAHGTISSSSPTWLATSVATVAPPTAAAINLLLTATSSSNSGGMIAPNSSYSGVATIKSPPICDITFSAGATANGPMRGWLTLESTSIYIATNTNSLLLCLGYKDNL